MRQAFEVEIAEGGGVAYNDIILLIIVPCIVIGLVSTLISPLLIYIGYRMGRHTRIIEVGTSHVQEVKDVKPEKIEPWGDPYHEAAMGE